MTFKDPIDVYNRKLFSQMTKDELLKETKKVISKLNRRITKLKKSGLSDYSKSYGRIKNYLISEYGTEKFSSKQLKNASFEERVNFLVNLKHFEKYKITPTDVKKQIKGEKEKIKERTGIELKEEQIMSLHKAMQKFREYSLSSGIVNYIDSETIRQFFTDHIEMSQNQINNFIEELDKFDKGVRDPIYIIDFIDNYDPSYNGSVRYTNSGIAYDPVDFVVYDEWHNKTNYTIDDQTEILYDEMGGMYTYNQNGELEKI